MVHPIFLYTPYRPDVPTHVLGVVALVHFLVTIYAHGRQQEWTYRLDFLWKAQVGLDSSSSSIH